MGLVSPESVFLVNQVNVQNVSLEIVEPVLKVNVATAFRANVLLVFPENVVLVLNMNVEPV